VRTLVLLLAASALLRPASSGLGDHTLDEWRALIEPGAKELAYAEIPWRPSFWSAVHEAQTSERPILLWAMNGHPLACT